MARRILCKFFVATAVLFASFVASHEAAFAQLFTCPASSITYFNTDIDNGNEEGLAFDARSTSSRTPECRASSGGYSSVAGGTVEIATDDDLGNPHTDMYFAADTDDPSSLTYEKYLTAVTLTGPVSGSWPPNLDDEDGAVDLEAGTYTVVLEITPGNGTSPGASGPPSYFTFNFTVTETAANNQRLNVENIAVTSGGGSSSDTTPPVVSSIEPTGSPNANDASVDFTVTFDENASNVTADDFTLTTASGTATGNIASISGSGTSYTVTVDTIAGTGSLRLDLNASTDIVDDDGNGNNTNGYVSAFSSGTAHTVDRDAPTVAITTGSTTSFNQSAPGSFTATITFSESVTGFTDGDLTASNATVGSISGSGTTYTATITPNGNGNVALNVAAGVAQDAASNTNTAATQVTVTQTDDVAPTVAIATDRRHDLVQ